MLTESDISSMLFSLGIAIFVILVVNNMIAAKFMEAPNNTVGVSSIAAFLIFTISIIFILLLKSFNILFNSSYYLSYICFAIVANMFIFSIIFNVDLMRGFFIALFAYAMTGMFIITLALFILWGMGFSHYNDVLNEFEPYLLDIAEYFGYK